MKINGMKAMEGPTVALLGSWLAYRWPLEPRMRRALELTVVLVLPASFAFASLVGWISWKCGIGPERYYMGGTAYLYLYMFERFAGTASGFIIIGMMVMALWLAGGDEQRRSAGLTPSFWSDILCCVILLVVVEVCMGNWYVDVYETSSYMDSWNLSHDVREQEWHQLKGNMLHVIAYVLPFILALILYLRFHGRPLRGAWATYWPALVVCMLAVFVIDAVTMALLSVLQHSVLLAFRVLFQGSLFPLLLNFTVVAGVVACLTPFLIRALHVPFDHVRPAHPSVRTLPDEEAYPT